MRNKTSPGEYLAFLSTKYEVDADSLFHALISAEENRKSKCGNLSIECRGKQRNKIILLITKDSKVVAQFPVSREFLLEQNNPIKDAQKADVLCRHLMKKDREPHSFQIKDLRIGMKKVSLKAEVIEIAKPMVVFTRFGNYATVTNALIADRTGQIKLCLWNEQIDSISVGETIQIENASISTFRGERQLRIGKKGILHRVESMIAN
jgi:replication factor A1